MKRRMPFSRLSLAIVLLAVAGAVGLFSFSREANQRDNLRLLTLQARDAKTSVNSLLATFESDLSSVGSVAAATNANAAELDKLATAIPSLQLFTTLTVLHTSAPGGTSVVAVRGNPSAPLGDLGSATGLALTSVESIHGFDFMRFFGHGAQRRLAFSVGAPAIPAGYVIYTEVPVPEGTTIPSGFPGLQDVLYLGRTDASPVLFASTKTVPQPGQKVTQMIDMNDLYSTANAKPTDETLLFVVSSDTSTLGTLANLLPWILAVVMILGGILVAAVVESTLRRKDSALRLVEDLEQKNHELDRAMAEQAEAEKTRIRLEGELRQAQRLEAIGQLAGGVAHDFNNILMVISSHADFIAEELPEDHPVQEDVNEVRNAAQRARRSSRGSYSCSLVGTW